MKLLPFRKRDNLFPEAWEHLGEPNFLFEDFPYPQVDVEDKDDHYLFEVELPGFSKQDLTVTFADGYLEISGEKEHELDTQNDRKRYIRKERTYGSFRRRFYIGEVEKQHIKSSFAHGLLTINVPKPAEVQFKTNNHIIPID
ncbi:HSP20 family protein [Marinococcus luteus]|uniref:HSP20 family protein n=1 Tax=Marinococcus luteus TaxID=1122204 RepID=A0A1H2QJ56_9BACI|nr:Hsp20/alpha crystallin family protein [Marinococcus luteus]SDW06704.1 HSP20 family protein [Marinococcus luteus]